mgnify:CR=1 FL=1
MMTRVKICGITTATDAVMAATAGADAVGFNFWPGSKRYIEPARAMAMRHALPPFTAAVGLFVDSDLGHVKQVAKECHLDYVQLHGHEGYRFVDELARVVPVIKAIRVQSEEDLNNLERYRAEAYLLDTYVPGKPGGTGETFDWELALPAREFGPVILAGGLTPENVAEAVERVRPYGVDAASGVEAAPGRKDRELMEAFVRLAKGVAS